MRHFSKLMLFLSSSIISFTSCYESALDKPAEKLSGNKVHAQMHVSLNYDDAVFAGDANVSNRRFIVETRDAENTENVVERKEIVYNTASTLTEGFQRLPVVFELDQKKYVVSVWMDYIETGTDKDFYYNTEDLSKISMITPESAADVHRDALASTQTIDLTEQALGTEFAVNAQMVSPLIKWNLTATDWRNLLASKDEAAKTAVINVAYKSGVARGFNLTASSVTDIKEGVSFESPITVPVSDEETKISLAEDILFTAQAEETIGFTITVKSADGEVWPSQKSDVSLTFTAGKFTKSEDSYLTGSDEIIKDPAKFTGEGTEENPYQIASAEDLNTLMQLINTGDTYYEYQTSHYKQTADIDVASAELSIGTVDYPFKGVYDGDGKKITNNQGLFGVIENATIKDVRMEGCNLVSTSDIGGLICTTSKDRSSIINCGCKLSATVQIQKTLGGVCGEVISGELTINGCKIDGGEFLLKITSKDGNNSVGGIIGKINSGSKTNVTDSYIIAKNITHAMKTTGDNLGGICGKNDGTLAVKRCYVNAKLQCAKDAVSGFGGVICASGSNETEECFSAYKDDKFYTGKGAASFTKSETDSNVTLFASDAWPAWATDGSTAWGSTGSITDNGDGTFTSVYPTLAWETAEAQ